jgi:hypothetical protein
MKHCHLKKSLDPNHQCLEVTPRAMLTRPFGGAEVDAALPAMSSELYERDSARNVVRSTAVWTWLCKECSQAHHSMNVTLQGMWSGHHNMNVTCKECAQVHQCMNVTLVWTWLCKECGQVHHGTHVTLNGMWLGPLWCYLDSASSVLRSTIVWTWLC